jgi:hypothetical protein
MLILFVGLRNRRTSKTQKLKKNKSSALSFFTCVFFPPLICVVNKKLFSVDYIGRAYKSAIPRGRLKCSAVLLLETLSCARQVFKPSGCTWAPHNQELGVRDYHLQIAVMADGDDLYFRVTEKLFLCFFPLLPHLHFEVKIRNPTNKPSSEDEGFGKSGCTCKAKKESTGGKESRIEHQDVADCRRYIALYLRIRKLPPNFE